MNKNFFKLKLIYLLAVVFVLLLISNLIVDLVKSSDEKDKKLYGLSKTQIEDKMVDVLNLYGFEESWIRQRDYGEPKSDSLTYYFDIKVPKSVPIPMILADLNKTYSVKNTVFKSDELKIQGKSVISVSSDNIEKLRAQLNYDDEITRNGKKYYLMIEGIEELSNEDRNRIYNSTLKIGILTNYDENFKLFETELNNRKPVSLLINDNINETKYKLDPEFSKDILKSNIKSLSYVLKKYQPVIIEKQSVIYNSVLYNFMKNEFKKRGLELHFRSEFRPVKNREREELISLFNFYISSEESENIFLIDAEAFLKLEDRILMLEKGGNIILPPSKFYD